MDRRLLPSFTMLAAAAFPINLRAHAHHGLERDRHGQNARPNMHVRNLVRSGFEGKSVTSGKAGGLICEPLKAALPTRRGLFPKSRRDHFPCCSLSLRVFKPWRWLPKTSPLRLKDSKARRNSKNYTLPELSNSLNPPAAPGVYRINYLRIQAGLQRATLTVASTLQPPASPNQATASWTGSILSV
jgi:hypothetical protein